MSDQPPIVREVQLWWASCSAAAPFLDVLQDTLDDVERQRAGRFRVADAANRFVAAHALKRRVLGESIGVDPASLDFVDGARGKPRLSALCGDTPFFNITHSGDTAVVALAPTEVGVDVEALRPVPNLERLARRFCSSREREWLDGLPPPDREAAFLALWTCKEAYLKAVGAGVAMPLRDLETVPDEPRLSAIAGDPHSAAEWTLLRADLPEPAVCTVAVRGRGWTLTVREHQWQTSS
jgi:4'-phosphopantetheinyl transferase